MLWVYKITELNCFCLMIFVSSGCVWAVFSSFSLSAGDLEILFNIKNRGWSSHLHSGTEGSGRKQSNLRFAFKLLYLEIMGLFPHLILYCSSSVLYILLCSKINPYFWFSSLLLQCKAACICLAWVVANDLMTGRETRRLEFMPSHFLQNCSLDFPEHQETSLSSQNLSIQIFFAKIHKWSLPMSDCS